MQMHVHTSSHNYIGELIQASSTGEDDQSDLSFAEYGELLGLAGCHFTAWLVFLSILPMSISRSPFTNTQPRPPLLPVHYRRHSSIQRDCPTLLKLGGEYSSARGLATGRLTTTLSVTAAAGSVAKQPQAPLSPRAWAVNRGDSCSR